MNKYRVKFSHMVQSTNQDLTNMSTTIIDVDDVYQVEPHVNIFTLIYSRFNVVGSINVVTLIDMELEDEKNN